MKPNWELQGVKVQMKKLNLGRGRVWNFLESHIFPCFPLRSLLSLPLLLHLLIIVFLYCLINDSCNFIFHQADLTCICHRCYVALVMLQVRYHLCIWDIGQAVPPMPHIFLTKLCFSFGTSCKKICQGHPQVLL